MDFKPDCSEGKDKRVLVLLALGALILGSGSLPVVFSSRTQTAQYKVMPDPHGQPELVRAVGRGADAGKIYVSLRGDCSSVSPRYALFFDLPLAVNHADLQTLTMLPGVGPKLAENILTFRRKIGVIHDAADLAAIKGISSKLSARLDSMVCYK